MPNHSIAWYLFISKSTTGHSEVCLSCLQYRRVPARMWAFFLWSCNSRRTSIPCQCRDFKATYRRRRNDFDFQTWPRKWTPFNATTQSTPENLRWSMRRCTAWKAKSTFHSAGKPKNNWRMDIFFFPQPLISRGQYLDQITNKYRGMSWVHGSPVSAQVESIEPLTLRTSRF